MNLRQRSLNDRSFVLFQKKETAIVCTWSSCTQMKKYWSNLDEEKTWEKINEKTVDKENEKCV